MTGLEALFDTHRGALHQFLTARTGNAADADDIVQEMWLKLRAEPSGPIANGRAYLYRMAQNLVIDRLRAARRRAARELEWLDVTHALEPGRSEPLASTQADAAILAEQEAGRLADAVAALPQGARRVFRLHKIDGLSHAETAARLGISRSGVEKHMAVAFAHLRRALAEGELG